MTKKYDTKDLLVEYISPEAEKVNKREEEIKEYLITRVAILKDSKKNICQGTDFEEIMRRADWEYTPRDLSDKKEENKIFVEDEVTGLRGSRMVNVNNTSKASWRSDISEPTLYVKIQTALSILFDQNPEATFKSILEKYEKTQKLAEAIWKRGWDVGNARNVLKLFSLNLAKYGWAIGRTVPRKIEREKKILVELDFKNPNNNKYEDKTIVEFDDIFRENLDPYRTWIDDNTNIGDPYSMRDWCFEKDYPRDLFLQEFRYSKNINAVKFGVVNKEDEDSDGSLGKRDDMITVLFYENKDKDLYVKWVEDQNIVLEYSPLPLDTGELSCWHTLWTYRDARTPYGIGLYELIKNNKVMYDRMKNMTVDQLTMALYPMLFYSGTPAQGDGSLAISPNTIMQKLAGTNVEQIKIDYDHRGWEAVAQIKVDIDDISGISPTLQGEITGKTLGEVMQAKEGALKRLNIPLKNIAGVLEREAILFLSWANQVYSLPEIQEFVNEADLAKFELERGQSSYKKNTTMDEDDNVTGIEAEFSRTIDVGLDQDKNGNLVESPEDRYLETAGRSIDWKGRIFIKTQSLIAPNKELDRQRKLELYNVVFPSVQAILQFKQIGDIAGSLALAKPVLQILEIQDEKPEDWLPDEIIEMLDNPEMAKVAMQQAQAAQNPVVTNTADMEAKAEAQAKGNQFQPAGGQALSPETKAPQANVVVPRNQISNQMRASQGQINKQR